MKKDFDLDRAVDALHRLPPISPSVVRRATRHERPAATRRGGRSSCPPPHRAPRRAMQWAGAVGVLCLLLVVGAALWRAQQAALQPVQVARLLPPAASYPAVASASTPVAAAAAMDNNGDKAPAAPARQLNAQRAAATAAATNEPVQIATAVPPASEYASPASKEQALPDEDYVSLCCSGITHCDTTNILCFIGTAFNGVFHKERSA